MGCGSSIHADGLIRIKDKLEAREWPIPDMDTFVFPELRKDDDGVLNLQHKPDLAICMSGGGFRATTCSLGWVRALWELGYLQKARYLCSNSGGSWFNTCFSYQEKVHNDVFLGPYIPPEQLTVKKAKRHPPGSYGKVVADATMVGSLIQGVVREIFSGNWLRDADGRRLRAWTEAVGKGFLHQHGVDVANGTFALAGDSCKRAVAATHSRVFVACRNEKMPFPIIVSCVAPAGDPNYFESYEFTPLYSGIPVPKIKTRHFNKTLILGGHLVEPFAASAEGPKIKLKQRKSRKAHPTAHEQVKIKSKWLVPPEQMAGMSSEAIAQTQVDAEKEGMWELMGCPEMFYWDGVKGNTTELGMADGAGTDNMAVFPALRRGVKAIMILYSNNLPAGVDIEDEDGNSRLWETEMYDVAAYFGRTPNNIRPNNKDVNKDAWRRHLQVFESDAFDELKSKAAELHKAEKPVVIPMKLKVLECPEQGVKGGYVAHTLWIFNGGLEPWRALLPKKTKLQVDWEAQKINLPFVPVTNLDYTPVQVGLLSQLCSWNIYQARMEIAKLTKFARAAAGLPPVQPKNGLGANGAKSGKPPGNLKPAPVPVPAPVPLQKIAKDPTPPPQKAKPAQDKHEILIDPDSEKHLAMRDAALLLALEEKLAEKEAAALSRTEHHHILLAQRVRNAEASLLGETLEGLPVLERILNLEKQLFGGPRSGCLLKRMTPIEEEVGLQSGL